MSKKFQRTCIGCNEKKDKSLFIRIVKNNKNQINIDKTGKAQGRGAYICNNIKCVEKVIKKNKMQKALGVDVSKDFYEELKNVIIDELQTKSITE